MRIFRNETNPDDIIIIYDNKVFREVKDGDETPRVNAQPSTPQLAARPEPLSCGSQQQLQLKEVVDDIRAQSIDAIARRTYERLQNLDQYQSISFIMIYLQENRVAQTYEISNAGVISRTGNLMRTLGRFSLVEGTKQSNESTHSRYLWALTPLGEAVVKLMKADNS